MSTLPITPAQCRAARGLMNWNQGDLARKAGVSRQTINDYESGKREPIPNNLIAIVMAFVEAGIWLIDESADGGEGAGRGRGVRFIRREGEVLDPHTTVALKVMREFAREGFKRNP
jgi:DNA-binding XRE family transcriptional regulator